MRRIAIVGGGIAGVTAAYELAKIARSGLPLHVTLFEASNRLGGIVETVREGGYTVECGPDAWVTEKPWARELALELGLEDELIYSNDATRKTHILLGNRLRAMPEGMRMMVPTDLEALEASSLLSDAAKLAYRDELRNAEALKLAVPSEDESVAMFVRRHFGDEVLEKLAAPLLSGVFGGDVNTLSVRAVMAPFVSMEREHGSLIAALQSRNRDTEAPIFTTLRSGLGTLVDHLVAAIPQSWLRLQSPVMSLGREGRQWTLTTRSGGEQSFDAVLIAAPIDAARSLLSPVLPDAAKLMQMESSSAVVAAFAFPGEFPLPQGFGFLAPPGSGSRLLACTFVDQKFPHRTPSGSRLLRAFFGGSMAEKLTSCNNDEVAAIAQLELARILGPLPAAQFTVVRRWPKSLPQYSVGHLERMAALTAAIQALGRLHLLGNAYRGVGLPDIIRDARTAARAAMAD